MKKYIKSKSFLFNKKLYKIGDLFCFPSYKGGKVVLPIKTIKTSYEYGLGIIRRIIIAKLIHQLKHQIVLDLPLKKRIVK